MRICFTVNAAWNMWNFRRQLVEAMLADEHEVHILAPRDESVGRLEAMGCRFTHLSMDRKGLNPFAEFGLLHRIGKHFRKIRPDIVFGFTIKNNLFGSLAASRQRIPFVPNVTGLGTAFLSSAALKMASVALYRVALRRCPKVFFQNDDDRALFAELGIVDKGRSVLLPGSGIDLNEFSYAPMPENRAPTTFLMIARLLRDKGVVEYAEAARLVKEQAQHVRFELLGDLYTANRTAISKDMLESWERSGTIKYLGHRDDVRGCIVQADCIVLPSYREGAPRTLIEAAAMGRPLIATDVPGCRAVVDAGSTGFLCAVRDAVSLADAMLEFTTMRPEQRAGMGREGRKKMEREFSVDRVIAAYSGVLKETFPSGFA